MGDSSDMLGNRATTTLLVVTAADLKAASLTVLFIKPMVIT
jgi:hypothetical protein